MRALILVLSALVVGLTVPVLLHAGGAMRAPKAGPRFQPGRLLFDAQPGEEAVYRDQDGNTLTWRVERRFPAAVHGQDALLIRRVLQDRTNHSMSAKWGDLTYTHDFARHGFAPWMAPEDPDGLDRRWVWSRIRQEPHLLQGKEVLCWRVDFLDPALPEGAQEVETWFHEDVAAFGLVEWHRGGRIWTLTSTQRGGRS